MPNETFLDKLAASLLENYPHTFTDLTVILPNRRAKVFLLNALKRKSKGTIFAPEITSIEEFVRDISGLRALDNTELLFRFYDVYSDMTNSGSVPEFDAFANWAKTLLQDFNEIDRYLIEPAKIFSYLKDIEDIKRWGIEPENSTRMIDNYVDFWKMLPRYYSALYESLLSKGKGYQGMVYREATKNIEHFTNNLLGKSLVFAGFNALNAAEEQIVQHLLESGHAKIYWDADEAFINDHHHDASLFLRRFKNSWKHFRSQPMEWIANEMLQPKRIEIISTPKTIGQARIAANIASELLKKSETGSLEKTAIILGEENLLIPLLYSLPQDIGPLNITMGYSAKNNPVQVLVAKIFKLHINVLSRRQSYVMYYKDVLDILTHPLVQPYINASNLTFIINRNNYTFISLEKLQELYAQDNRFFNLIFRKWDVPALEILATINEILHELKTFLERDDDRITKAFLYAVFKAIRKITGYFEQHPEINSPETLYSVYKQSIDLAEVSFEGEPLQGLQIMGVLESRTLDFENVIITSMNEGRFPAGKSSNSFIPYDVKREYNMPTFKEKDAIYTYHFYHLLQRAKNVYLIYNTENEGLDGGEKSRFITQLEVETREGHELVHRSFSPGIPDIASNPVIIPKSSLVMERLKQIAADGFSPSALTSYIRNPLDFYNRKVLRVRETEEVEENIAVNTLGTIIHEALRGLLSPFIGIRLTKSHLESAINKIEGEVKTHFLAIYKQGEISKGKNLLAFEVAKRHVRNLLRSEIENLENDNVTIIALEQQYSRMIEHPKLPFPVRIHGNVDRVEMRNGTLRIIDYKSGRVEKSNLILKEWSEMVTDIKYDKIIQILAYAYIFDREQHNCNVEAGIISFKNMKAGFMPFTFKEEKNSKCVIDDVISHNYVEHLVDLIAEILNPDIPFIEKV